MIKKRISQLKMKINVYGLRNMHVLQFKIISIKSIVYDNDRREDECIFNFLVYINRRGAIKTVC